MIAYCHGQAPITAHPALMPCYTIWPNRWEIDPKRFAAEAVERMGGVTSGRFAIGDQPPGGGRPHPVTRLKMTYDTLFGNEDELWSPLGVNLDACKRLRDKWLIPGFAKLQAILGAKRVPDLLIGDWEWYSPGNPDFADAEQVQHYSEMRRDAFRATVMAAVNLVWGRVIPRVNYGDTPWIHDDKEVNGRPRSTVGVGEFASQVLYGKVWGTSVENAIERARKHMAYHGADQTIPWLNEAEVAKSIKVDRIVAWGSSKAPSTDLQRWVIEQYEGVAA